MSAFELDRTSDQSIRRQLNGIYLKDRALQITKNKLQYRRKVA